MNYIVHGEIRILRYLTLLLDCGEPHEHIVMYMEGCGTMCMVRREICRWVSKPYKPMNVHAKNSECMAKELL
jgi:hypothetical protein